MKELLDLLNNARAGGQPLRDTIEVKVTTNANGEIVIIGVNDEAVVLSKAGGIEKVVVDTDHFHDCGCLAGPSQLGGQCKEPGCHAKVCVQHMATCSVCCVALCMEHRRTHDGVTLCPEHARKERLRERKQRIGRVTKTGLRILCWPLVAFEKDADE